MGTHLIEPAAFSVPLQHGKQHYDQSAGHATPCMIILRDAAVGS
jgi:hypothetical protein